MYMCFMKMYRKLLRNQKVFLRPKEDKKKKKEFSRKEECGLDIYRTEFLLVSRSLNSLTNKTLPN